MTPRLQLTLVALALASSWALSGLAYGLNDHTVDRVDTRPKRGTR